MHETNKKIEILINEIENLGEEKKAIKKKRIVSTEEWRKQRTR